MASCLPLLLLHLGRSSHKVLGLVVTWPAGTACVTVSKKASVHLYLALLAQLRQCDQIHWSRTSIDGASVTSPWVVCGGNKPAPTPPTTVSSAASGI